jgi:integrase
MRFDYKGLLKDKTAAGTIRWRVRVEGDRNRKIRIPVGPEEPLFQDHYAAARSGDKLELTKPARAKTGTLDELCDNYLAALKDKVDAGNASALTLKGHKSLLSKACDAKDPLGDRMGILDADMPEEGFVLIQDSFGSKTGSADNCIKALKAAYRWGEKRGYPKMSPVFGVQKVHKSRGGATPWSVEEFKQFLKRHESGSMARLWLMMSLNTLPRIGDAGMLGGKHLSEIDGEKWIGYQPSKRGSAFVSVPALPQFLAELALHDDRETLLQTEAGNPFASPESLRNKIQDWTAQAGLPNGRTQHGVRKGAAELLAAAGATQYEIMCLMSHTEAKTSEVYTKRVERAGLAKVAIARMAALNFENVDHG